ncbi:hypothetical protein [Mucilaginibacter sp. L3T2-6]|uniref:hypothetical protein n=1 Tax=Mucilaginibacter sp. L3T2-6 TaxID=3062491 RepID=UPI00267704E8|nr:hypothetical protein [Mucilaginibacter sp. L3T2-6]MDO3644493.1 hypothetical protein [Mucilaginibacter sp. L3T2-6]MDV6216945.1 hypothetical protein [Mucilaginibacter sp. L3T2-6]
MKRSFIISLFAYLFFVLILPFKTFAGFPIGKYRNVIVPTFSYYRQTDRFDDKDHVIKGAPGTSFTSYSSNLFIGYGISRRLDVIATIPYLYQQNIVAPGYKLVDAGLGDAVVGFSYNLVNTNFVRFFSIGVSAIVPLYNIHNGPSPLGLSAYGSEVKLMYCGNLPKDVSKKGYFNLELGYRKYYDTQGPDQVSLLGSVGYPVSRHDQFSLDILLWRSFSSNKEFNENIFAAHDYSFFKPQLNYGHTFTRRFSAFVGGFYVPFGVNTGVGYGGSLLAVIKL